MGLLTNPSFSYMPGNIWNTSKETPQTNNHPVVISMSKTETGVFCVIILVTLLITFLFIRKLDQT